MSNAFLLFVWEVSSKSTALQILQEVSLMARKLTVLTVPEEKAWQWAFEFYVNDGLTDDEADSLAWSDVQKEFPRLKALDGCEAKEQS